MPDPQAQRTLVKSPPELWAEISDVGTLARHLGEFGEIRITRTEAETTVAWEGDRARGTVELEPSGWGTKVTITAEVVEGVAAPEALADVTEVAEVVPEVDEPVMAEEASVAVEEPQVVAPVAEEAEPEPAAEPPRRGFFARLFRRRAADPGLEEQPAPEAEPALEAEPAPMEPAAALETQQTPDPVTPPEVAPTPVAAATLSEPDVEAVLVGALDSLGSAHHRPFSRG